jgi:predicted HNH restriction endonuclease
MAILAMCFDLMQEEIIAKFRWIGRKVGIIEKDEDSIVNQNDKTLKNNNNNRRPSTASSMAEPNPITNTNGKIIEDENENGWSTQRSANGTRKLSPRNNIARVHPMTQDSNEGTLYQRTVITKID